MVSCRIYAVFLCYRKLLRNVPITQKSPPGRIALRRRGIMSLKRPAAGGESCLQDSFLLYVILQEKITLVTVNGENSNYSLMFL